MVEEMGFLPNIIKTYPLHTMVTNDNSFEYYTYLSTVKEEFIPKLNNESIGYSWISFEYPPEPLHSGSKILYNPKILSKIKIIIDSILVD